MKLKSAIAAVLLFAATHSVAALAVRETRCEFLKNPVGIDTAQPRFSWTVEESDRTRRGQDVSGYSLRVL